MSKNVHLCQVKLFNMLKEKGAGPASEFKYPTSVAGECGPTLAGASSVRVGSRPLDLPPVGRGGAPPAAVGRPKSQQQIPRQRSGVPRNWRAWIRNTQLCWNGWRRRAGRVVSSVRGRLLQPVLQPLADGNFPRRPCSRLLSAPGRTASFLLTRTRLWFCTLLHLKPNLDEAKKHFC